MNRQSFLTFALALTALSAAVPTASAQNIWLSAPGTVVVTPNYTSQSFDKFYAGTAEMTLPADITQRTTGLNIEYGLAPRLALDVSVGYTQVKFKPPGASFKRSGRDDSRLGITYAILEESDAQPALTFRFGGIFAGNYDVPTSVPPINPGDGAGGFEGSFAAGKSFGEGFFAYGEVGYRNRSGEVPDDLFFSGGVAKQFGGFSVNVGYRRTQGLSGGDIGGPGFGSKFGFPGVKEITQFAEGGAAYTDSGGRSYQVVYARRVGSVRNTGDARVWAFSVSFPFKY